MEYVFGTELDGGVEIEVVKTVSDKKNDMSGAYTIERQYADQIITDTFKVVGKIREKEANGLFYDWHEIENHYRYTDKFTPGIKATEQEITDLEIEGMEQEQAITDLDIAVMELQDIINK